MFSTLMPLFDDKMAVAAFSLFAQKGNFLLNPSMLGTGANSGIGQIDGLDVIENTGIETLAADADIFVSLTDISIFADVESQCKASPSRIVLLIDKAVLPNEMFLKRITELKTKGYRFAVRKLFVADFEAYKEILKLMDFILLDYKRIDISKAKIFFSKLYPNIKLVAINVDSQEVYDNLVKEGGYTLYEGDFYRLPVTKGKTEVSPVKATYIEVLNVVNDPDFDLTKAADIIGRDTALVVSLLKMVNRMSVNGGITTIRHAAAMLGQKELKKWINTAVASKLCEDKPSEITRISLIRAKFAEKLATVNGIGGQAPELFLMGLFSVLDILLNVPMAEALEMVKVSKNIEEALLNGKGEFADILNFVKAYEVADWSECSRLIVVNGLDTDECTKAYLESLSWYRDLYK